MFTHAEEKSPNNIEFFARQQTKFLEAKKIFNDTVALFQDLLPNELTLEESLSQGNASLEQNELSQALIHYLHVLGIDPTNTPALNQCVKVYKKFIDSEQKKDKPNLELIQEHTANYHNYLKKALSCARENKKEEDMLRAQYAHLIKVHLLDPTDTKKKYNLSTLPDEKTLYTLCKNPPKNLLIGWKFLNAKKYTLAIPYFNKVILEIPYDFVALTHRGIANLMLEDYSKALIDFNAALNISNYSTAYYSQAFIYLQKNERALAKQGYLDALKYCTEDCSDFLKTDNNKDEILKLFNDLPLAGSGNSTSIEASTLIVNDPIKQKIAKITSSLQADYKNVLLYRERGYIYFEEKKYEQAIIDFSIAISLQEDNISLPLRSLRRKAFIFLNNLNAAIVEFNNANILYPESRGILTADFSSECHFHGKNKLNQDKFASAIASFKIALDNHDKNIEIHIDLATALYKHRDLNEALHYVSLALALDKHNNRAVRLHQRIFKEQQDLLFYEERPRTIMLDEAPAIAFAPLAKKEKALLIKQPDAPVIKTKRTKKSSSTPLTNQKTLDYNLRMKEKKEFIKQNAIAQTPVSHISSNPQTVLPYVESLLTERKETPIVSTEPDIQNNKAKTKLPLQTVEKLNTKIIKKQKSKYKLKQTSISTPQTETPKYIASETTYSSFSLFHQKTPECEITSETLPTKLKISLPAYVINCLSILKKEGHKSFVGGGYPRDVIIDNKRIIKFDANDTPYSTIEMNLEKIRPQLSDDIDIITTQTSQEIERLLAHLHVEKIHNVESLYRIKNPDHCTIDIYCSKKLEISMLAAVLAGDFKANALLVDQDFNTYDPTESAVKDILNGVLNTVVSASQSFLKDPIRILRGIYLSSKCPLTPSASTHQQMESKKILIMQSDPGKINVWLKKLFLHGHAEKNYKKLLSLCIINSLFPSISKYMQKDEARILVDLQQIDQCRSRSLTKIFQLFMLSAKDIHNLTEEKMIEANPLFQNEFAWQNSYNTYLKPSLR